MKSAKRILLGVCLATAAGFVMTGCSKKNDPAPAKKVSAKHTVTITGSDADDDIYIQAAMANGDASQYGEAVWKINGVTQGNEHVVELTEDDFAGNTKTYVLESLKAYDIASLKVGCRNYQGATVTLTYKAEINGKVETLAENISLAAGQNHDKSFTYTGK